ncbi:MAG: hypothetical protein OEM82_12295, partial [Acidobacteriota bacterium]|nr:hypothetical protein [Acidobacteriota bacterium]
NTGGGALVWIRYAFMARYVDPAKDINWFVSDAVQPSSPQIIPGSNKFSFVYRRPDGSLWIKEFDPQTKPVRPIVEVKDGKIDYCWWGRKIVMGSGAKLWAFDEASNKEWRMVADLGAAGISEITRLAASPKLKRLAVVSSK